MNYLPFFFIDKLQNLFKSLKSTILKIDELKTLFWDVPYALHFTKPTRYNIVGCRGASLLGGSLLGIPLGCKANKL